MYAKYSMGLGILCLGHSSAYFALGYLSVQDYYLSAYAACVAPWWYIGLSLEICFQKMPFFEGMVVKILGGKRTQLGGNQVGLLNLEL